MNQEYLRESGIILADVRLRIEGIILLYEEDALVLLDLAAEKKPYHATGALDVIAVTLYDMRKQIIALQTAYRNAVQSLSGTDTDL